MRCAWAWRELPPFGARCLEAKAPGRGAQASANRDSSPGSAHADLGCKSQPCFARTHDRLIAMFDAYLVEHARDVVAHGLLREPKRGGDFRIVQAPGDAFEHGALARR